MGLRYSGYLPKDVFLKELVSGALNFEPDGIVHMGACSRTDMCDADYLMENNFQYTRLLAQWAVERNVRLIYASSAATYGIGENGFADDMDLSMLRPLNRYAYSKHLFDLFASRNGLLEKIVGLKFFNVFGPNEYHKGTMTSVAFQAFHQIQATGEMMLFKSYREDVADGEQKRDFIYIKDCVDVLWWLLNHPEVNGLYNLGTGKAHSWNELVRAVFWAMEHSPHVRYVDMPDTLRPGYQYHTQADMRRLKQTGCPLTFRSLEAAIDDYVANHLMTLQPHLWLSWEQDTGA